MSRDRGIISFDFGSNLDSKACLNLLDDLSSVGWPALRSSQGLIYISPLGDDVIDWEGTQMTARELRDHIVKKIDGSEP